MISIQVRVGNKFYYNDKLWTITQIIEEIVYCTEEYSGTKSYHIAYVEQCMMDGTFQVSNFRDRRRIEREQKLGPEKKIVDMSLELATLECGHTIVNPPIQKTTRMQLPRFYRCVKCK